MSVFIQFLIGLLFGAGLVISGMSNPDKVLNFLDLAAIWTRRWDPSLLFVMLGGIGVAFFGYRAVLRRKRPWLDDRFHVATATNVTGPLLAGSALFGLGWGLVGFCPGPAFTAIGNGSAEAVVFVVAMLAGMLAARRLSQRRAVTAPTESLQ